MLVLYILLGLLALLLILLLVPLRFCMEYSGEVTAGLSYLFFKFRLLPREPVKKAEKKAAKEAEKETRKEENLFSRTAREEGLASAFGLAAQSIRSAVERFLPLFRRLVVERLYLDVTVAAADAAKTATEYGAVCAAVFPLRGFLGGVMTFSREHLVITPDFSGKESRVKLLLRVRLRPIFIVGAAIRFLCDLLSYKWKNRKTNDTLKVKDGAKV